MFVEYEKMSKKQRKEHDRKQRGMWNINPITRKTDNGKAYNRQANKKAVKEMIA